MAKFKAQYYLTDGTVFASNSIIEAEDIDAAAKCVLIDIAEQQSLVLGAFSAPRLIKHRPTDPDGILDVVLTRHIVHFEVVPADSGAV